MSAKYRLIQFVPSVLFPATVTVGVIAKLGSLVELRLVGLDVAREAIRAGAYIRAFNLEDASEVIIGEWLHWFRNIAIQQSESGEEWIDAFADLSVRGAPFVAQEEGESDIAPDQLSDLADDIYRRSVFQNPTVSSAYLEDVAEFLLEQEGVLEDQNSIDQDAELELLPKRGLGTGLLYFPWFYDNGTRKIGFRTLNFNQDPVSVGRQVSETLNTFEVAIGRKLLDRSGCAVFHDSSISQFPQYEKWLGQSATLLNVDAPDVGQKISALT